MLRLLSFVLFLATWWIASLVIGDAKLPAPPAVLAVAMAKDPLCRFPSAISFAQAFSDARQARVMAIDIPRNAWLE